MRQDHFQERCNSWIRSLKTKGNPYPGACRSVIRKVLSTRLALKRATPLHRRSNPMFLLEAGHCPILVSLWRAP
jgi:hypothetical protein